MSSDEKRLEDVVDDLAEAKKILRAEKTKLRKLKGDKLEKDNAERALETLEKGVKGIQQQRDLLQEKLEEQ